MKILLRYDDLKHSGQQLYGRGRYQEISLDDILDRLRDHIVNAERVRILLPDNDGIDFG